MEVADVSDLPLVSEEVGGCSRLTANPILSPAIESLLQTLQLVHHLEYTSSQSDASTTAQYPLS